MTEPIERPEGGVPIPNMILPIPTPLIPPGGPGRTWQAPSHNRRKAYRKAKRQIAHQSRRRGR